MDILNNTIALPIGNYIVISFFTRAARIFNNMINRQIASDPKTQVSPLKHPGLGDFVFFPSTGGKKN